MSAPDQPIDLAQTGTAPPGMSSGLPNSYRMATVAAVMFLVVLLCGFIPLEDSSGATCGSAFNPGPQTIIDEQTTECAFRVSTQQGFVYPLMLIAASVAVGGFAWRVRD
jgi:preprotein translocase subunit SecG